MVFAWLAARRLRTSRTWGSPSFSREVCLKADNVQLENTCALISLCTAASRSTATLFGCAIIDCSDGVCGKASLECHLSGLLSFTKLLELLFIAMSSNKKRKGAVARRISLESYLRSYNRGTSRSTATMVHRACLGSYRMVPGTEGSGAATAQHFPTMSVPL